jgi:hypothetical protein
MNWGIAPRQIRKPKRKLCRLKAENDMLAVTGLLMMLSRAAESRPPKRSMIIDGASNLGAGAVLAGFGLFVHSFGGGARVATGIVFVFYFAAHAYRASFLGLIRAFCVLCCFHFIKCFC